MPMLIFFSFNDKQRKTEGNATTDLEKKSDTVSLCSTYKTGSYNSLLEGHICYHYLCCSLCPGAQQEDVIALARNSLCK